MEKTKYKANILKQIVTIVIKSIVFIIGALAISVLFQVLTIIIQMNVLWRVIALLRSTRIILLAVAYSILDNFYFNKTVLEVSNGELIIEKRNKTEGRYYISKVKLIFDEEHKLFNFIKINTVYVLRIVQPDGYVKELKLYNFSKKTIDNLKRELEKQ